jgi:hypothetical protein
VGDNLTNFNKPRITGTAEPNSTVQLFDGGSALTPTAVADGSGNWSITLANSLTDGPHNLTAKATDAAGNTGSASSAVAVTIDTTVAAPTGLALAPGSDDGIPNDNITSVRTPTVLGQAEANSTVRVFINGAQAGTTTASALGDWSFTSLFLADGVYSFTATAIDRAANTSVPSAALVVTIQRDCPAATAPTSDHAGGRPRGGPGHERDRPARAAGQETPPPGAAPGHSDQRGKHDAQRPALPGSGRAEPEDQGRGARPVRSSRWTRRAFAPGRS